MPAPIVEAVTAVLSVADALYMVRRQPRLSAFPGYHAFPGGKLDAEDRVNPMHAAHGPVPAAVVTAMYRELHEELGLDHPALAGADIELLGRALTPPIAPVRYDTWFVQLRLPARPDILLDSNEAAEGDWGSASEWLQRYEQGQALMSPPTRICLRQLAGQSTLPSGAPWTDDSDADIRVVETLSGLRQLLVRSNTIPPAEFTNCFLIGDDGACRLLVDPSPRSVEEFERLCRRVQQLGVDEILITHHHPDHRERANRLALHFGLPMVMSETTRQRIANAAPGYFDGCPVRVLVEGDVVTRWKGQAVRVLEVPGHDDGQLALMPDSRAWCIVGDLIQGIGTVVIKRPEGNMARYFESLQKIIDLEPAAILPSHGLALGTTWRLAETLSHRHAREARVLELARKGLDADGMLPQIYADLDPHLLPLARMNIESHLDKLRDEGWLRE